MTASDFSIIVKNIAIFQQSQISFIFYLWPFLNSQNIRINLSPCQMPIIIDSETNFSEKIIFFEIGY